MAHQISKGVRLPAELIKQIEKTVKVEGSTFSQFIRTAAIKELNERRRQYGMA